MMAAPQPPGTGAAPPLSIWDIPERGGRGPKARHSRAAIAAAAVALADAEGLDAVTMRRVAAALGMGTMSLYNYVPAKEHLVQLMIDQVGGEYRYPPGRPPDAREAIIDLARQGRDITERHPWLPRVMHAPATFGPSALRYVDYFLRPARRHRAGHHGQDGAAGHGERVRHLLRRGCRRRWPSSAPGPA